jgi:hypothetical protein
MIASIRFGHGLEAPKWRRAHGGTNHRGHIINGADPAEKKKAERVR